MPNEIASLEEKGYSSKNDDSSNVIDYSNMIEQEHQKHQADKENSAAQTVIV